MSKFGITDRHKTVDDPLTGAVDSEWNLGDLVIIFVVVVVVVVVVGKAVFFTPGFCFHSHHCHHLVKTQISKKHKLLTAQRPLQSSVDENCVGTSLSTVDDLQEPCQM